MNERFANRWRFSGNRLAAITIILSLFIISGCASTQTPSLPAITSNPTGQYQTGKFVWFDLLTEDVPKAQRFYKELFGWRFTGQPTDYVMIYSGDKAIGGIVPYESKDPKVPESMWIPYLSVEDVNAADKIAKARGGEILDGPFDVKGRGRMAVIRDPEGAKLVLIRAKGGDPVESDVGPGEWLWVDLLTRDVQGANDFYKALVGYTVQTVDAEGDHAYHVLQKNGKAYGGVVKLPWKEVEPNWLPYLKVDDLGATMGRAEKLGGIVIVRTEDIAVLADPGGGVFGIQIVREK